MKIPKLYATTILYLVIIALLYAGLETHPMLTQSSIDASARQKEAREDKNPYDIFIDLTESMLYLFENGQMIKKYPIAQGKPSTPSPVGIWHIINKARNWGTGFGTRWMGLDVPWGTYGIHGTNRPDSIGRMASKGCIRMRNRDVEELYSIVPYMTRVVIYGGPYGSMGSLFRVLEPGDRSAQVAEVQKRLQRLGYYQGSIDGIYGEGMKAALLRFKRDNKLQVNHYVDWETYKALGIFPFE
ncbi:MAG TPA: L,D-transpeptidase family protein [Candidatus Atribacteria bacterium]|nr:L,D-transpeptidase family protein [Candidatus Atribacteria bacterium]HPT78817.1 L,D-transpeptidase family protein [Candidatus Atribacteria bacterium]